MNIFLTLNLAGRLSPFYVFKNQQVIIIGDYNMLIGKLMS